MRRSRPPRTAVESSLLEVEGYLRDFGDDNDGVCVTVLRFSSVLGPDLVTPLSSALEVLRHGRGVDTSRLQQHGFRYEFTSAGAFEDFWRSVRLRQTVGEVEPVYRYERDVEAFFRHSPAVIRDPGTR